MQVLESSHISYEDIDVSDPSAEQFKTFMWTNGKAKGKQPKPIPPQVFNDDQYCGVSY